jgi:hypothetical protein
MRNIWVVNASPVTTLANPQRYISGVRVCVRGSNLLKLRDPDHAIWEFGDNFKLASHRFNELTQCTTASRRTDPCAKIG